MIKISTSLPTKISDDRRTSVVGVANKTSIVETETWSLDALHATLKLKSSHVFISSWIKSSEVSWLNFWSCISYHFPTERSILSFLLSGCSCQKSSFANIFWKYWEEFIKAIKNWKLNCDYYKIRNYLFLNRLTDILISTIFFLNSRRSKYFGFLIIIYLNIKLYKEIIIFWECKEYSIRVKKL